MKLARLWLTIAIALALASCGDHVASTPLPPTEVRTITVDRPVAVPCVAKSDIPAAPPKVGTQLTGDAGHDLDVVSASALRLRGTLDKALALLGACTF